MVFPDHVVEFRIGDTWTDITGDVYARDPIVIERGLRDEGARAEPGTCALTLNNCDGKYSPRNPTSPHYGLIGRNTPARVAVRAGSPYLDLPGGHPDLATTPDHASLDITGDIDVRIDLALTDWIQPGVTYVELAGKNVFSVNQRSWFLALTSDGEMYWEWSTTGADVLFATSTEPVPVPPSGRLALRVTLDVDNGAGGRTVTFHTAPSGVAGPWTQLGDPVTGAGTTSIFNSTAPVDVGGLASTAFTAPVGQVYAFELRDGIDGTAVADPDFTAQTAGATSITDSAGRTWTINGAASLTNRRRRAEGEIPAWPPRWDVSGTDVWTPVEAAGILRRLGQGASPLPSTLARRIPSHAPVAYWPMEEGADATRAYSPIAGVQPLKVSGFTFASDDTLGGSGPLPEISDSASMTGTVPAPATASGEWSVMFVYSLDGVTPPAAGSAIIQWHTTGTVARWRILQQDGTLTVQGYDTDDALVVNQAISVGDEIFDGWDRRQFRVAQDGANVDWRIVWTDIGGGSLAFDGTYAGDAGRVTSIATYFSPALAGMRIGHLSVWDTVTVTAYDFADHGFVGESAGDRIARVCAEEDVPVTVAAPAGTTTALGPQRPQALLDILGQAADADAGILYEWRDAPELRYRGRTTLYNQTPALTLDYAAGEVAPPLEPTDDDQALRNDITVSRTGGSSAPAVLEEGPLSVQDPPDGVGRYDESVTVNVESDDQLDGIAWWRLHLGTWDEARYPAVTVNLAAAPHLIDAAAAVDIGDRIALVNLPSWLPPGGADLIVQGYAETIAPYWWEITYTCTPAGPWNVATADDDVLGRADTDGSELAAAVDADDTTLPVAVTDGPLWTTDEGEFPFDARLGGEVVTVTAITGTTSPQNWIATRAVNGVVKAHAAGTAVRLAHPAALAL